MSYFQTVVYVIPEESDTSTTINENTLNIALVIGVAVATSVLIAVALSGGLFCMRKRARIEPEVIGAESEEDRNYNIEKIVPEENPSFGELNEKWWNEINIIIIKWEYATRLSPTSTTTAPSPNQRPISVHLWLPTMLRSHHNSYFICSVFQLVKWCLDRTTTPPSMPPSTSSSTPISKRSSNTWPD